LGKHKKIKKKKAAGIPNRGSVLAIVEKTAGDICLSLGMRLAYVDSYQNEDVIISVFIDKPGGVTLDDCVKVNRELGDVLDVELDVTVPYRLEVSSPGIDFIYPESKELEKKVGNEVEICVEDPGGKRKKKKTINSFGENILK